MKLKLKISFAGSMKSLKNLLGFYRFLICRRPVALPLAAGNEKDERRHIHKT